MKTSKTRRSRSLSLALSALRDLLSRAEHYHLTSDQVNAEYHALRERFNLRDYEWQYLRGYRDCQAYLWQRQLDYRYEMPDGRLVAAKWDDMSEADREHVRANTWNNPDGPRSGFYWTGTDKPWFVSGKSI